jgi:hypothetical protein
MSMKKPSFETEKDKLELLLIAEKGLERILQKVRSHIELCRAVDAEKRKRDEKPNL